MKRWIALALVLLMALSLTACGGQNNAQTPADADAATTDDAAAPDADATADDSATPDADAATTDDAATPDADAATTDDAAAPDANAATPDADAATADDAATPDADAATADNAAAPDNVEQIANPFMDYATYEEAEKAAGFRFAVPEQIGGFDTVSYRVAQDLSLFEVIYANEKSDLTARKAPGGWNISGDYNEYKVEVVESLAGADVTCWGDGDALFLAMWTAGDYSYSLGANESMDRADFLGVVETIIDLNAA